MKFFAKIIYFLSQCYIFFIKTSMKFIKKSFMKLFKTCFFKENLNESLTPHTSPDISEVYPPKQ